ncbi:MAG TPA: ABC transporter permease [Kofleriaceae bacterium]|nr:ABC transporter permease [Kofleriaceae bacterium]
MNLAIRDVRRHLPRFVGTAAGLGLLLTVVVAMQGIYAGMVEEATILTRTMHADLWVVQRDTRGPFAETSRIDPTIEARVAAVPGVRAARPYTYQLIQREHHGEVIRIALVGLGWPDDVGQHLPLVNGRALAHAHGEIIVDASLGLGLGDTLVLADEPYQVVGITRHAVTSGGDSVAFMSLADTQLVAGDQPAEAAVLERARVVERLRGTDLGHAQPGLEELAADPRWQKPAIASPPLAAVLVTAAPHELARVRETLQRWGDVSVYSQREEEQLLLGGVIERARMQIGLFTVILTITASVIVMMVMFTLTLEKTHDLAVLKLMGTPRRRLAGFVLQQAWLLGVLGYLLAYFLGEVAYPKFPRRVVLTDAIRLAVPLATMVMVTLASLLGLRHVLRIDPAKALEG